MHDDVDLREMFIQRFGDLDPAALSISEQESMAQDGGVEGRYWLVENFTLTVKVQETVLSHGEPKIREALSWSGNLSPESQATLAGDRKSLVRGNVARMKNLSPALYGQLSRDTNREVRQALSRNHSMTDQHVLEHLAKDGTWQVRMGVAMHPSTPLKVMEALMSEGESNFDALAVNVSLPEHLQLILCEKGRAPVLRALAENPNITLGVQVLLAGKDSDVQAALAGNDKLHPAVQESLLDQGDEWMRGLLARNPSLTPKLQERIWAQEVYGYSLASNPALLPRYQHLLFARGDVEISGRLARNPSLEQDLFVKLSFVDDRVVRNNLSTHSRARLTTDLSAGFASGYHREWFEEIFTVEGVGETARGLLLNWKGSVAGLMEACKLVERA